MRARTILPSLLVLAGVAAGCADGAVAGDAPAPVAGVLDLVDGEHFGFLVGVAADAGTVTIDPAVWVDDLEQPNGFRIDDPGVAPIELPVADDAVLEIYRSMGDPSTAETVTVAELGEWYAGLTPPKETAAPFDVTVAGGEVVELRFVYRP